MTFRIRPWQASLTWLRPESVLDPAQGDDPVDLVGALSHGVGGLKGFHRSGGVAVGEADDGAHRHPARQIPGAPGHVGGGHADTGRVIGQGLVAEGADLLPAGVRPQQGVVHMAEQLGEFHIIHFIHDSIHPFRRCFT